MLQLWSGKFYVIVFFSIWNQYGCFSAWPSMLFFIVIYIKVIELFSSKMILILSSRLNWCKPKQLLCLYIERQMPYALNLLEKYFSLLIEQ